MKEQISESTFLDTFMIVFFPIVEIPEWSKIAVEEQKTENRHGQR